MLPQRRCPVLRPCQFLLGILVVVRLAKEAFPEDKEIQALKDE